jgi:signal transduction histidine kinase
VEIAIKMAKNFTGKKVKFYSDYGGECEILCFRHEIIQILVNLFKNSFEAFSNGIGNIYIITRNKYYLKDKTGKDVEIKCVNIEITDDGPGIPVEIQNKVFELEYSTKKEKGGSGRGLSLVKELIDSSYGKIVLESPVKDHPEIHINCTKFKIFFEK